VFDLNDNAKQIFTHDMATTFRIEDYKEKIVEPVRSGNRLFFAAPNSPNVEVWELRKIPIHTATIQPAHQVPVSHLHIKNDMLIVGHKDTYLKYKIADDFSPAGGGECLQLIDSFEVKAPTGNTITLKELTTDTIYSLPVGYHHFIPPQIGVEYNWAFYISVAELFTVLELFHLQNKTPIQEFARFPFQINSFIMLGWQHCVQGKDNLLHVYSLYNLKRQDNGICTPNVTYVLPEGHTVTTAWFHKGILIAGDNKGKVWRFMKQKSEGSEVIEAFPT
jgi:hypothetical protein